MSMPPARPGPEIATTRIRWKNAWRIIATRYPPIHLFERVSDNPAVWDVLIDLEQATNPRVRDEVGDISLVPPERRVSGPNASWVMAPFTHTNPRGSRFSDGGYGVYYCAQHLQTAIAETMHHFGRIAEDSNDPPRREAMRVLVGSLAAEFHDITSLPQAERLRVLDPNSYSVSQEVGRNLRNANSNGVTYPSVRHVDGRCAGAFWPDIVGIPIQERHLQYEWNGKRVSRYFDYSTDSWTEVSARDGA